MKKTAVVVIPTYNEKDGIKAIVPQIFDVDYDKEKWDLQVLIVDGISPDGTRAEVEALQKKYPHRLHLLEKEKQGLGRAYIQGFTYAIEKLKPYVLFEMDGDGQHPPDLIPAFLKKIEAGADFVIGSRYIKGGSIPSHWTIDRKFYSIVGSLVAQLGFMNFKAHDWTSGYRCIKAWYLKDVVSEMGNYTGYVFQIALLDKAFKRHLQIAEVPLNFVDRIGGDSKFNSIEFIINALSYVLLNSSFIRFALVGFLGAAIDFGAAATFIHKFGIYKPTANALSAEIAIVSNFLVNNFWSFRHKRIKGSYVQQFLKFNFVSSGAIFMQWLGMKLALETFGDFMFPLPFIGFSVHTWILYKVLIIGILVIPYSYIMYNLFIWKAPAQAVSK